MDAPREPEETELQKTGATMLKKREAASLEETQAASRKGTDTASLREPEAASLREPEVASQREPEAASQREPEAASLREPKAASQRELEAASQREQAVSVREPEAASQREPAAASQREPEAASVREPEATSQREPDVTSQREPEAASTRQEAASLEDFQEAPLTEPEKVSMTTSSKEQHTTPPQETRPASKQDSRTASQQESVAASPHETTTAPTRGPDPSTSLQRGGASARHDGASACKKDVTSERNYQAPDTSADSSSVDNAAPSGNDASDNIEELIKASMASMVDRLQSVRAGRPAGTWDHLAERLSSKFSQDEQGNGSYVHANTYRDPQNNASAASRARTSTNGGAWPKEVHGGARPKEMQDNGCVQPRAPPGSQGARPKQTWAIGGARPKEKQAMKGARPNNTEGERGARPENAQTGNGITSRKEFSSNGGHRDEMLETLTNGNENTSVNMESPSQKQEIGFQWRGHRNDLLNREQHKSLMHMVFPSPCFNNHTVHLGYLNRGNPIQRVDNKIFYEVDNGVPIFRCEEESDCFRKCPLSDGEGFPVVAMSFDSFCRTYHVAADQCQNCEGGVGLARASTTGRARLIYEQMNGAHPQQTAFRIWEHERAATVRTSRGQPPPTNTLISVEKVHIRDIKPQEYEHLFSVLVGLRGVQSLFTITSAYWNRTDFANFKSDPEQRKLDIASHVQSVTKLLEDVGVLHRGDDHKLRGMVPARCRPGKDAARVEAEPWFPRIDRNCVEMQWLQSHRKNRKQERALDTEEVVDHGDILWGTMISVNEPMAERYYLDMPFAPDDVPAEERLVTEERQLSSEAFRQTFLTQLKTASEQEKPMKLGPYHSWNGVLYTWRLRRPPEECVQDLKRSSVPEEFCEELEKVELSVGTLQRALEGDIEPGCSSRGIAAYKDEHEGTPGVEDSSASPTHLGSTVGNSSNPAHEASGLDCEGAHDSGHRSVRVSQLNNGSAKASCSGGTENYPRVSDDSLQVSQYDPPSVVSTDIDEFRVASRVISSGSSDEISESQKSGSSSSKQPLESSTDMSNENTAGSSRARIARVGSKDSGYPHGSGSGSGTDSRDDSVPRSGSFGSGTAPPGSGTLSSSSGHVSPAFDQLSSYSDQSPIDKDAERGADSISQKEVTSPSDSNPASGDEFVEKTHSTIVTVNDESNQSIARHEERMFSNSSLNKSDDNSPLSQQLKDTSCQEDGNVSDTSTIKGNASPLTKTSRRRSSGEMSGSSDFDDAGTVFSKTFSPSKSSGQSTLLREEGIPGEALQISAIPEERDIPSEESQDEKKSAITEDPNRLAIQTRSEEGGTSSPKVTDVDDLKDRLIQLGTDHIHEDPQANCDGKDTLHQGLSELPQSMIMCAQRKCSGFRTSEAETKLLITDSQDSIEKVTGKKYTKFVRTDDRKRVNHESLRSLSAKDFKKLLLDSQTCKYLLNVRSGYDALKDDKVELHDSQVATSSNPVEHRQGEEGRTPVQKAGRTTEGSAADMSARAALKGASRETDDSSRSLPKPGLRSRAYRRSPLRFLGTLETTAVLENRGRAAPPAVDINEQPFGLSSISRRQIENNPMQTHFICRRIMQLDDPLNCLCKAKIDYHDLRQLATKLEEMCEQGRQLQFIKCQRKTVEHICKESVMSYAHKADSPAETDIKLLHDLMIILGLHHDKNAKPYSYCRDTIEHLDDWKGVMNDGRYAELPIEKAALLLARHHIWSIRQEDFFDTSLDDPLTRMTLHEHGLRDPEKAKKLTPFQLFLEWYLNDELLEDLCEQLNGYAERRKTERLFRGWTSLAPDEMRVFLLQMIYMSSSHPQDTRKRWDGPPRRRRLHKKRHQPLRVDPTIEETNHDGDTKKDHGLKDGDSAETNGKNKRPEDKGHSMGLKAKSCRPNISRLYTSMAASRFRQIANAWRVFDFCAAPRRSESRRRLKQLQTVLDTLLNSRVTKVPALLAVGSRGVRCRYPPVARRLVGSRRVEIAFVMDGKRYTHGVIITEAGRRQRNHTIHPNVVTQIRKKLRPCAENNMFMLIEFITNTMSNTTKGKQPGTVMDNMLRFFYMDGLRVSEAERCADEGILCLAPIPPDDPRYSEYADVDEGVAKEMTDDHGRLICASYGSRQKVNFFHAPDSACARHRMVCSAFHRLSSDGGRRALQQVDKTQKAVREAVRRITGRLYHGSPRSGLRYYHRLFLRALSACIQNAIIARAVARKKPATPSASSTADPTTEAFDSSAASLWAHCETEFQKFLSELMNWLEAKPRVKARPPPKLTGAEMHARLTQELLNSDFLETAASTKSEMLVHGTNQLKAMKEEMTATPRVVGGSKKEKGPMEVVMAALESDLF